MPLTTPIIITRTIAQHVAHRDAERANYAADLQIGRTPWEIEDSLARLAAAEGALSDALLALYRPELLAGSAVPDVAAVGAPCAICRRALTAEDLAHSGAEGACGSCTTWGRG